MVVESTQPFVFVACCAYLDSLNPGLPATVLSIRPREPDFSLFCVARDEGTVIFQGDVVEYNIASSDPVSSDAKPEPFRQLVLRTHADRSVLLELVRVAIEMHRHRMTAPRGQPGAGVMRYTWDEDAQCWDGGKLVPHRSMDSMFLPHSVAEDAMEDLHAFLERDTLDKYASLHIAPVRVYMLHGLSGAGKSTLLHCLASETGCNLAVLNFRQHTSDHDIATALRDMPARCLLCIEDIDCLFDTRCNRNHGVSFSSLLAALDGVYNNAHGTPLTVFMTTNTMELLDVALRRRVDYAIEFTHATKQQCRRMFAAFHPNHPGFESLWAHIGQYKFSMSILQKFLVRTLSAKDPMLCLDTFGTLVECSYGTARPTSMYA